jgi:hypothetical protein
MLARRTNLLPKPPVVETAKPSSEPYSSSRIGKWHRMTKAERKDYVRQVWEAAPTIQEAADVVGCTANSIAMVARRLGLPPRKRGTTWGRLGFSA